MKKRSAALSWFAGLIIFGMILPLHAAAQSQQKAITFEQFMTLPKLDTVTQEIPGTFADTKIEYMSFNRWTASIDTTCTAIREKAGRWASRRWSGLQERP